MSEQQSDQLGRLRAVPLREVWAHEARDFTPWLLANADVLGEALGMDLELQAAEHPVGGYSLDLIGRETSRDELVIVENQLEASDHGHLGQLLTYASGTDAVNVVWIASSFREEHRAALDWLNSRTDESTRFFGVEVSAVRIGTSPAAPLLKLVASPNDWNKIVRASAASTGDERAAVFQEFWGLYLERLHAERPTWTRSRTAPRAYWLALSIGTAGVEFVVTCTRGRLTSQIYFGSANEELNTARFEALQAHQAEFDEIVGPGVEWDAMEGRKASRVSVIRLDSPIEDRDSWPEYVDWFIGVQDKMRQAYEQLS